MKWFIKVLKHYADFNGRARRTEYWMFALFNLIFIAIIGILDYLLGTLGILCAIYCLATLLPALAVLVRRLHDSGKSGWWALLLLVPYIGQIVILVFLLLNGELNSNRYGTNPRFFGTQTVSSNGLYLGNIIDAEQVEIAGNQEVKGEAGSSAWGIIGGFAVTAFLLWGGLSGNLVLRGTESSNALVILALLLLVYDCYKLVRYVSRGNETFGDEQSDEFLTLANLDYLQCPKCGSKSFNALHKGGTNVIDTEKAIVTNPMTYQCDDCKQQFSAVPKVAAEGEIIDTPCEVLIKRMPNMLGAAQSVIVYLNGVKVNALKNGKAISFPTCVKHNTLVVTDHTGIAFKGIYRFEAEPAGRVQVFFDRKFL